MVEGNFFQKVPLHHTPTLQKLQRRRYFPQNQKSLYQVKRRSTDKGNFSCGVSDGRALQCPNFNHTPRRRIGLPCPTVLYFVFSLMPALRAFLLQTLKHFFFVFLMPRVSGRFFQNNEIICQNHFDIILLLLAESLPVLLRYDDPPQFIKFAHFCFYSCMVFCVYNVLHTMCHCLSS